MTSATLAILILVTVGAIAVLVIYILLPQNPPLTPEQAINDSIIAQQWAGDLDHPHSLPIHPLMHSGIDGGG
jgi:hypothetical protein